MMSSKRVYATDIVPGMLTSAFYIVISVQRKIEHVMITFITPRGGLFMYRCDREYFGLIKIEIIAPLTQ